VLWRDMQLLFGQLPEFVQRAPMHHGLLGRKLRAHLSAFGRLQLGLFGRSLLDLLRRRDLRCPLFGRELQHVMPPGGDMYGRMLRRQLRPSLRAGVELLLFELLRAGMQLQRPRVPLRG
jgi:hypothetical protein